VRTFWYPAAKPEEIPADVAVVKLSLREPLHMETIGDEVLGLVYG